MRVPPKTYSPCEKCFWRNGIKIWKWDGKFMRTWKYSPAVVTVSKVFTTWELVFFLLHQTITRNLFFFVTKAFPSKLSLTPWSSGIFEEIERNEHVNYRNSKSLLEQRNVNSQIIRACCVIVMRLFPTIQRANERKSVSLIVFLYSGTNF